MDALSTVYNDVLLSIFTDLISVMADGGCCSRGCHGYLHVKACIWHVAKCNLGYAKIETMLLASSFL